MAAAQPTSSIPASTVILATAVAMTRLSASSGSFGSVIEAQGLLERAEEQRTVALQSLDLKTQVALGQYFTPYAAARLIASMPRIPVTGTLRVLDPGAGSGSLTAALLSRIIAEAPDLKIELVAVEFDQEVAKSLSATLADCAAVAKMTGVDFQSRLVIGDYIEGAPDLGSDFDIVIMNPPYGKLAAQSHHRKLMSSRGVDTPNFYAAFMALGAANLADGGQLVAITPRSFANGAYFDSFRRFFLSRISLDRIHVFESRSTVFADTGVLQENIIISGTRHGTKERVQLSASTGHEGSVTSRIAEYEEVVRSNDPHRFIRIPSSEGDREVVALMLQLPARLDDLGLTVSTGRVVDFRSRSQLADQSTSISRSPMVYPANMKNGVILHPNDIGKAQHFSVLKTEDSKLLVPEGNYVLIKRFSAKEERRRIVAGTWIPARNGAGPIAMDNKLNYIHQSGKGLDLDLAAGLALWLNSTPVDMFFRTFSGHTQVNATDLRTMPFPSSEFLRQIGKEAGAALPAQDEIDRRVSAAFSPTRVAA